MYWKPMCSFEQALHCLHDRTEWCVDDLQSALRVAATRMITSKQLEVPVNRIQRCSDLMSERSSHLANRGQTFRMRQTLLRANQISIRGAQLAGREEPSSRARYSNSQ